MTTTPDERAGAAGLLLERADAAATSPDKAAALYRELLAASPEHVAGRRALARLLLKGALLDRLGRPDEAREMYQRSRELQDQ